jgi:hypothetical protein
MQVMVVIIYPAGKDHGFIFQSTVRVKFSRDYHKQCKTKAGLTKTTVR